LIVIFGARNFSRQRRAVSMSIMHPCLTPLYSAALPAIVTCAIDYK